MSVLSLGALSKSVIEIELLALFSSSSSKISECITSEDDRICRVRKLSILIVCLYYLILAHHLLNHVNQNLNNRSVLKTLIDLHLLYP